MSIISKVKIPSCILISSMLLASCSILGWHSAKNSFISTVDKLVENGKYKQAAELMRQYGENADSDPATLVNFAWMDTFSGQYSSALDLINKVVVKSPKFQEAYYLRGYIYTKLQKYDQAEYSLKKAIVLNQKDLKSYNDLAELYLGQKNYNEAIIYYTKASKLESKNYIYHLDLANAYFHKENFKMASEEADKAFNLAPKSEKEQIDETRENIRLNAALKQDT